MLAMLLSACSTREINLVMESKNPVNVNTHQQSLPLGIKIFTLKSKEAFEEASFLGLWKHPKKTLGNSLLQMESKIIIPNETSTYLIDSSKEVKYLGLMGVFRKPKGRSWKSIIKIPSIIPLFPLTLYGEATRNNITIH
jgi:type VI secretion system protein VasD